MAYALPVTLCYMLADLKAKMEQHCRVVSLSHPTALTSDAAITDCCTARVIDRQCGVKGQHSRGE